MLGVEDRNESAIMQYQFAGKGYIRCTLMLSSQPTPTDCILKLETEISISVKLQTKDEDLIAKWKQTLTHLLDNSAEDGIANDQYDYESGEMAENIPENLQRHFKLGPRNTPLGYVLLEFFRRHQTLFDNEIPEVFADLLGEDEFQYLLGEGDVLLLHDQMQRAYHILALHCDVTVLLEVASAKEQISCHLTDQLSAWIAGSEAHHSKLFSEKSGAKVRIRPRLPGLGTNLLLEASGTGVALRFE
jgi:hypothetical protein